MPSSSYPSKQPELEDKLPRSQKEAGTEKLTHLLDVAKQSSATGSWQSSKPKIQKVQPYLRERPDFARYYSPKLVAMGPIHHPKDDNKNLQQGKECKCVSKDDEKINLRQGEKYKEMWTSVYLNDMPSCEETAEQLLKKIRSEIGNLKGLYAEDAIQGCDDEELAWMFFMDGCAALYFLDKVEMNVKSSQKELKIKVDQQVIVLHDLLLLENQLPFLVLKLLTNNDDAKLWNCINNFINVHHLMPKKVTITDKSDQVNSTSTDKQEQEERIKVDQPTHLLDLLRSAILQVDKLESKNNQTVPSHCIPILGGCKQKEREDQWPTHRNIQELKASGIRIKTNENNTNFTEISFLSRCPFSGKLYLPKLMVDDFTPPTFLNMMAYETCPDFENEYEISSYVTFLDSLIDHPDDVKELRKAGVLRNLLGSDEDVAKLFNTISSDLVFQTNKYEKVRGDIEKHYQKKCMTWMNEAYNKHFSSPWATIGLVASFLGIFLALVQTSKVIRQFIGKD